MRVLYLSSEASPLIKVGGLADVAGELPRALRSLGVDVRIVLPFYPALKKASFEEKRLGAASVKHAKRWREAEIYSTQIRDVPVYLVDGAPIRQSNKIYDDPLVDVDKFAFFSLAALTMCKELGWQPEIVHANDWHAAMSMAWLKRYRNRDPFWTGVTTLFTVHNLPYMGSDVSQGMKDYDVTIADLEHLPPWSRTLPLPIGLATADWLSTVSPSYAEEIQTPEFGHGLEDLLHARRERLVGILNGIDSEVWNPAHDSSLTVPFSYDDIKHRERNKQALQGELGLEQETRIPLLAMITRLDHQKGIDIALDALLEMMDVDWQFVLLGTGDTTLEDRAEQFSAVYPDRVCFVKRFAPRLARRIYAGSDMMIIPSRYEPCGLAQMIAMRYGSIPVVRSTGGLKDTVEDYDPRSKGTGFAFGRAEPRALRDALCRGLSVYRDRKEWGALQRRAMIKDFSWKRSSEEYYELYRGAIDEGVK
ncbi:MAG TPA: glycogen synthase [Anaerolineae bacterium]|nr:glycogen synthase [Anaerolineae bacterium]